MSRCKPVKLHRTTVLVLLAVLFTAGSARAYWIQHANNSLVPAASPEQFRPAADGARPGPGHPPAPIEIELLPVPYEMPQGLEDRVERAVQKWDRIPGSAARLTFKHSDRTLTPDPDFMQRMIYPDGRNTIEFLREDWFEWLGSDVIAITIPHLDVEGRILEADLFCNARDYRWVILDREGVYPELAKLRMVDVEAVITHEMGHMLGLGHSQYPWACMYVLVGEADTRTRRLTSDDRAGIRNLYPLTAADQAGPSIWGVHRDSYGDNACGLTAAVTDVNAAVNQYVTLNQARLTLNLPPLAGDTAFSYCLFGSGFGAGALTSMDVSRDGVDLSQSVSPEKVSPNFVRAVLPNGAGATAALSAGTYDLTAGIGAGARGTLLQGLYVNPATNNLPTAVIDPSRRRVEPGKCVQLDGSASNDADGSPLTYAWSIREAPPGSADEIADPDRAVARLCPSVPGLYVARLTVNDGLVDSPAEEVLIRAYYSELDPDEGGAGPMNCAAGGSPALPAWLAALPALLFIWLRRKGLIG